MKRGIIVFLFLGILLFSTFASAFSFSDIQDWFKGKITGYPVRDSYQDYLRSVPETVTCVFEDTGKTIENIGIGESFSFDSLLPDSEKSYTLTIKSFDKKLKVDLKEGKKSYPLSLKPEDYRKLSDGFTYLILRDVSNVNSLINADFTISKTNTCRNSLNEECNGVLSCKKSVRGQIGAKLGWISNCFGEQSTSFDRNDETIIFKCKQVCNDTDGLNYEIKGVADGRINGLGTYAEDKCVVKTGNSIKTVGFCSGSTCRLEEGYCNDNSPDYQLTECAYGCANGACKSKCADITNLDLCLQSGCLVNAGSYGYPKCEGKPEKIVSEKLTCIFSDSTLKEQECKFFMPWLHLSCKGKGSCQIDISGREGYSLYFVESSRSYNQKEVIIDGADKTIDFSKP